MAASIDHLIAAAAASHREFDLGTRLYGSRLVACRLLDLKASDLAARVLRDGLASALDMAAAAGRDEGLLLPIANVAMVQATARFETDLDRTIVSFEQMATAMANSPADGPIRAVMARELTGQRFADLGRHDRARFQFDKALTGALALPERDESGKPRLMALQVLVQSEAEAGYWDAADAALPFLHSAAAATADGAADDAQWRRSIEILEETVGRREWPPRP